VIELTLTLKMTTSQIVETSVTVNNNSPIQDYVHPDDQTQPTFEMTPGLKLFTDLVQIATTWCNFVQFEATWHSLVQLGAVWCRLVQLSAD